MGKGLTFKGLLGSEGVLKELLGCGVRENRGSSRETNLRALSDTQPRPHPWGVYLNSKHSGGRRGPQPAGLHSADLSPMALSSEIIGQGGSGPPAQSLTSHCWVFELPPPSVCSRGALEPACSL